MALKKLTEIQREVDQLSDREQKQLAEYLHKKISKSKGSATPAELAEFKGTLKLRFDPVEFQRTIRAEWD